MKDIKRRIILILQLAQTDFSKLNEVIRQCNTFELHPVVAERISEATKLLQYMDTLTQKLTHILFINQAIMDNKVMQAKSGEQLVNMDAVAFLFRVNYFQARMVQREFQDVTNTLKQILDELRRADYAKTMFVHSYTIDFKNIYRVETDMDFLLRALHMVYSERKKEHLHAMCPSSDVQQIHKLYTMNSERLILEWLQFHQDSNVDELLQVYARNGFGQIEEQTELF